MLGGVTFTRWAKRIAALALALGISGGLWWLRPIPATPEVLALLDAGDLAAPTAPEADPTDPEAEPAEPPEPLAPLSIRETHQYLDLSLADSAPTKGVVFLQGARIDPRSYARILAPIARAGYLVSIVKSPFDLAITDIGGISADLDRHPEIKWWAIGGHSLGGVAASTFASGSPRLTPALFLWASYPYTDMSDVKELSVLSVSGTTDTLTTPQDVEESRAKLPNDAEFVAIEGANHSVFGDFGTLPSDGELAVPADTAQEQIVAATLQWLNTVSSLA